jgi:molybdopterin molybdotransferase
MPSGANAVVIVEEAQEIDSEHILVKKPVASGKNILRQGEDAKKGEILIQEGQGIGPLQIGLLASVGFSKVPVFKRPVIGILCTGKELKSINEQVKPYQVRNANGPMIAACLQNMGWTDVVELGTVNDSFNEIHEKLRKGLEACDIILSCGGVSVGKYDLIPEVVEKLGFSIIFHKVAIKPGKPTLYAKLNDRKIIFGLPGNPLSALVAFHEFVMPGLLKILGKRRDFIVQKRAALADSVTIKGSRMRLKPGKIVTNGDSSNMMVAPIPNKSSADIVAAGRCDGVMVLPIEKQEYKKGDIVEFHSWKGSF